MSAEEDFLELKRAVEDVEDRERAASSQGAAATPEQPKLQVSINSPHTAAVLGNAVSLNIKAGSEAPGAVLGPIVLTLDKNGIPTDYNISGEEVV